MDPAVQADPGCIRADVMEGQRGDDGVRFRYCDSLERALHELGSCAEPTGGDRQNRRIDIDSNQPGRRHARQTFPGERSGADAKVHDGRQPGRQQGGRGVEHFLVVRDECSNPSIVLGKIDSKVRCDAHVAVGASVALTGGNHGGLRRGPVAGGNGVHRMIDADRRRLDPYGDDDCVADELG